MIMSDPKNTMPPIMHPSFSPEPDFAKKIQERIEEGKRNAPEILRQVALSKIIKEKIENAK
jgi:hypothetical protein